MTVKIKKEKSITQEGNHTLQPYIHHELEIIIMIKIVEEQFKEEIPSQENFREEVDSDDHEVKEEDTTHVAHQVQEEHKELILLRNMSAHSNARFARKRDMEAYITVLNSLSSFQEEPM